jgi:large subunit ribosomal protein L4
MKEPKTKTVASFIKALEMDGKRILFLGDGLVKEGSGSTQEKFGTFIRSLRNIPKSEFMLVPNVNGYDLIVSHDLVIMDSALDQLKILLGGQQ